jgi:hypothetical protein
LELLQFRQLLHVLSRLLCKLKGALKGHKLLAQAYEERLALKKSSIRRRLRVPSLRVRARLTRTFSVLRASSLEVVTRKCSVN